MLKKILSWRDSLYEWRRIHWRKLFAAYILVFAYLLFELTSLLGKIFNPAQILLLHTSSLTIALILAYFTVKKRAKTSWKSSNSAFQLKFLTYMIPKKFREEFLGDFLEQRIKMQEEKQPNWYINLVSCGQIFFMVVAMLKVRLWDWVDPEKEKNK